MKNKLTNVDLGVIETIRHVIGRLSSYQRTEIDNMYNYFDSQELFFNMEGVKWLSFYIFDDGHCISFLESLKENEVELESIFGDAPMEPDKDKIDDIISDYLKSGNVLDD